MQRSFNLIKEASRENEISLCTFNQKVWLPEKKQILNAKKKLEEYCKEVKILPIPSDGSRQLWRLLVLYSFFSAKPYTINWTTSRQMRGLVDSAIREYHPDVIHCDMLGLAQYVSDLIHHR